MNFPHVSSLQAENSWASLSSLIKECWTYGGETWSTTWNLAKRKEDAPLFLDPHLQHRPQKVETDCHKDVCHQNIFEGKVNVTTDLKKSAFRGWAVWLGEQRHDSMNGTTSSSISDKAVPKKVPSTFEQLESAGYGTDHLTPWDLRLVDSTSQVFEGCPVVQGHTTAALNILITCEI